MTTHSPNYVIGIGASAGGLEAIQEFFNCMPKADGLIFIIVQHLSPDFSSMMSSLLTHNTSMPIEIAKNNTLLQKGVIYLIPATFEARIKDNCFVLSKINRHSLPLPINTLFESIAINYKHTAIGIILSGTGSDGALGMTSIAQNHGLTITQTPSEAKFTDMPNQAIATQAVNYVLSVSEIPNIIMEYMAHPNDFNKNLKQIHPIDESVYADIFHLLNQQFHANFSVYKIGTISRRIQRRMQLLGIETVADYANYLTQNPEGFKTLYQYLLIGVTEFFRDAEAFAVLETEVLPQLIAGLKPDQPDIRIWVAACSTGEEAYSLAILLKKYIDTHHLRHSFKIFASDVFPNFIQKAKKGRYSAEEVSNIPDELLQKYFMKLSDCYEISPDIKRHILFTDHNLVTDPPFTKLDFISCRNLLIYIKPQEQKRILDNLRFSLKIGGFLFLGPSEGLSSLKRDLAVINQTWKIFKKIKPSDFPQIASTLVHKTYAQEPRLPESSPNPAGTLPLFAYNAILQEVVTSGFIIDTSYMILHSIGKARDLITLPEGTPTLNLPKIIIEELRVALIAALHQAKIKLIPVVYDHIRIPNHDGNEHSVKMSVHPICDKHYNIAYYWIRFDPIKIAKQAKIVISHSQKSTHHDEIIIALEGELVEARAMLQSSLENMETVNEEMQSTNEELMASNEELQSTNEELQSVNEELNVVNLERSKKIEEVSQSKDDIDNLIRSAEICTLILNSQLEIRIFTPGIKKSLISWGMISGVL